MRVLEGGGGMEGRAGASTARAEPAWLPHSLAVVWLCVAVCVCVCVRACGIVTGCSKQGPKGRRAGAADSEQPAGSGRRG